MDKLKKLMAACKCGVFISVNEPRDYYQNVAQWFKDRASDECPPEVEAEIKEKMIALDTVIEVQFYPDTPVGYYVIYHYDLDAALERSLDCLKEC